MSTAEAMRFDMLKNDATAAMSQMSRSLKPSSLNSSRSASSTSHGVSVSATAKSSMARWRGSRSAAVVHRHQFAEHGIARRSPHGGAMRRQAVVAAILARHGDRDHLPFELR